VLDRRIQDLQQSRPGFTPRLRDLSGGRAAVAELMAVVEAFLELPLQSEEREGRAICALDGARGFPSGDHWSNSYLGGRVADASVFRPP
jgi:hypothetical protein